MIPASSKKQKQHFNLKKNRYSAQKLFSPPLAQQLEIRHMETILRRYQAKNIMDFGSGSGRMTFPYLAKGYNVHAVDSSEESLSDLLSLYDKNKDSSWGRLTVSTSIPSDKKFDAVIGSDILHHVNITLYLPLIQKSLKQRGVIVFSEPNAWHLPWYFFIFFSLSWEIEKGILQCTRNNFYKELKKAGFRDIHIDGHGLIPTKLLDPIPSLSRLNALQFGNIPIIRYFAFRLLIYAKN